ncbi:MAG: transposase [Bryobacteraceae bacterium]
MASPGARKRYPTDVSDEEWAFAAPYLTLMEEEALHRLYPLREVFNGLRYLVKGGTPWRLIPHDLPPWEVVYLQTQRWIRAQVFAAMVHDLREVLRLQTDRKAQRTAAILDSHTLQSTPESGARSGAQAGVLAERVRQVTGENVELAWVDRSCTGPAASPHGVQLEVVKLPAAKNGFVLLPRRWVVDPTFGWATRFRRLVRDFERLPKTVAGMDVLAFSHS